RALPTLLGLVADPLYASEAVRALGRLGDSSAVPMLIEHLSRSPASLVCAIALALESIHEVSERRFGTGIAVERALLASPKVAEVRRQLALALKRADPSEQSALGRTLAWVGEESTVPALLDLLRAPSDVAKVAAASLKRLGAVAEPQLVLALRAAGTELRRVLIPILNGKRAARDELMACLGDEDPTVRALACDALARTSDPAAVPSIFGLLCDPDARVAQAALGAIQSLGSGETKRLALEAARSGDLRLRRAALRVIGYFGYPEGLDALTEGSLSSDEKLRDAAISGLPFIEGPEAVSVLLTASRHESPRTRIAAVRALGHTTGEPGVRERLRLALTDSDAWVRYYACQSLGRLHDDPSTEAIAALLSDEFGQVRVAAVEALAHLRGPDAFSVLSGVLASEDVDLYRAALVALGLSKRAEALPYLLNALSSADTATRLVALSALAELGAPAALPAIARATRDSDEGVRVAATGFLATHVDPRATSELIQLLIDDPSRQDLVRALARVQPGRAAVIAAALSGADDALATALVAALARSQSDGALLEIRSALQSPNDAARRAAASALIGMQDTDSNPALERAALSDADAEVRRICGTVLVR
ncbi:MAG: HEAT repeat domain-containing protein, partial [Myxococcales bacterium]